MSSKGNFLQTAEALEAKDDKTVVLDMTHLKALSPDQMTRLAAAIIAHQSITEINLEKLEICNKGAIAMAGVIKDNPRIEKMDLGYNKIKADGMIAIGEALATNTSITEMKLHRQETDMGSECESKFIKMWDTNITLTRLYITLHDPKCNNTNTKAEVRNKDIARLKGKGESYRHLDPATAGEYAKEQEELRKKQKEDEEKANAPISEKVESTGGPYTLKQLICNVKYRPDDVDTKKRETYLSDDEFEVVFKMDREAFGKLQKWKQNNAKKAAKLH